MNTDIGYLQFGEGQGPFRTQRVPVKMEPPFNWYAHYEGRWRKVHERISSNYIVVYKQKIIIQIEGV